MSFWQHLKGGASALPEWLFARWKSLLILFTVALLSSVICQNPFEARLPRLDVGQISKENIRAPENIRTVDSDLTEKKRAAAAEQVLDVYDFDPEAKKKDLDQILRAFRMIENQNPASLEKVRRNFEEAIDVPSFTEDEWQALKQLKYQDRIKQALKRIFKGFGDFWIVDDSSNPQKNEILVRDIRSGEELRYSRKMYLRRILAKSELRETLQNAKRFSLADLQIPTWLKEQITSIALKLIDADLVYNKLETDERRQEVQAKIDPVWAEISKGEMILREGQRVDRDKYLLLEALRGSSGKETNFLGTFQFALFLAFLTYMLYWIGRRNFRKFKLTVRDQMVMGGFFVGSLAFLGAVFHLLSAAKAQSDLGTSLLFLMPFAFAGMSLRLFSSMEITTFFIILFSTAMAWMIKDPFLGLVTLVIALTGAARMRHIAQRLNVIQAGLTVGAVQGIFIMLGMQLKFVESSGPNSYLLAFAFSLISGLFCSGIILGVQPLLEYLGYTTDLRLMELSSTNHPLLKEMIIKAPGTYFHSFTVSQLAEKAAEAIHANALFARVASLYHDIGKIKKPHYFIENIKGENKHDKLVPTMSALIISNHVKDGIELAYEHKLPQSIIEIIPQHHGTSLISFFYDKAKKHADSTNEEVIDEHDFRYPGPKPQTREGAIILLADAVEATAKALPNKTPEALRQAVHTSIQRFFLDGQLNECDLSLKDLTAIGNAFLQVLQGVYHQRIDYPHLKKSSASELLESAPVSKIAPSA